MNPTFWLIAAVLLLIALAIIIPPLWKKRDIQETDAEQRNVKIAQDRAADLKQQLAAGVLTQQQFDEQFQELELTLGDDLITGPPAEKKATQGRWIVYVIVLLLPLLSVLAYLQLGEPDALQKAQMQQQAKTANINIDAMIAKLQQHLQEKPDDARGWFMLGRTYNYLKHYQQAADAFAKAYALAGENEDVMLQYADALAMANGGRLSGKPAELIFKVLQRSPNSVMALWLGGMAKAEAGDSQQAMQYWRSLEKLLEPGSQSHQELLRLMAAVKPSQPGAGPAQQQAPAKTGTPVSIAVQVTITEAIKAKINPDDTLFIYAKALTGPPMPLAIVRKKADDLPLSVTLDDSMAMLPNMKLSNFQQLQIIARISKSGGAMQQKGDFIGKQQLHLPANPASVLIVIDQEIK